MNSEYLSFAKKITKDAGQIILQFIFSRTMEADQFMDGAANHSLTELDSHIENHIKKQIKSKYPTHRIDGEVIAANDKLDYEWMIAPIDGIFNHSIGIPLYGISLALTYQGKPIVAVISLPTLGEMFWASKNEGAFLNGKPIRIRNNHLTKSFLSIGNFSDENDKESNGKYKMFMKRIINEVNKVRIVGTASATLAYIAAGCTDAALYYSPKYRDIAAGELLITEAGGIKKAMDHYVIFANKNTADELCNRIMDEKTIVAG